MKHNLKITFLILGLFLLAHFVGLFVLNNYQVRDYPYGIEPPEVQSTASFIEITVSLVIITLFALLIIKLRAKNVWKFWFFLSLLITMLLSFASFMPKGPALIIAFVLAFFRIFKNNVYLHNFTEMFVYGGLASIFVPILNIISISILLIIIAIYDYISVYKTKHMVKMAQFQTESKLFAGLMIPYDKKVAILGGGDVGFTLLFSGVILYNYGWVFALISSFIIGLSLLTLLIISKKNKFYPAMPFLTAGCFVSLGIILLIRLI